MKITVKTLKGSHFEIRVQPTDTVMAVKKNIEDVQGKDNYPCGQQLLIHNGKVLKDETTLADNKVSEDGFLVVMLSKSKTSAGTSSTQPAAAPTITPSSNSTPAVEVQAPAPKSTSASETATLLITLAGKLHEKPIEGRSWCSAKGIPETAEVAVPVTDFPAGQETEIDAAGAAPVSGAPNTSLEYVSSGIITSYSGQLSSCIIQVVFHVSCFNYVERPQETLSAAAGGGGEGLGSLDFLRSNQQFQALRSMVQSNPQILQPMLQELGKQNPHILRMIQEHHAEFLQLINEPLEESEGDIFDQVDQDMPHAINVTPAEQEARLERLEAMGFDRALVIEAFWLVIAMRSWPLTTCWKMLEILRIEQRTLPSRIHSFVLFFFFLLYYYNLIDGSLSL
ncbi:hypothetical protein GH714_033041 [Hevea brasiliensis]|uniref:Ubiquitin receptor RAD23 n=1 Tax=Hevea brasiliensis TaxID=3981 RepID=A0A6A6NCD1_HEVBR|nr:hypothetical protein GH714_033041 [Hevea brasiliensis]